MAEAGLKAMARTKAVKLGHFIVEFATPGIGHIMKNRRLRVRAVRPGAFRLRLRDGEERHALFRGGRHRRRSCACRRRNITTSPAPATWARRASCCRWSATPRKRAHILDCMKYHPEGKRGVALGVAHDNYTGGAVPKKLAAANQRTTLFCQIETAEGVKNADAIAAVDGVDCLWVGHFDLSVSLGIPGRVRQSEIHQGDRHGGRRLPQAQEGAGPPGAECRDRHRLSTNGASISSAIPAMSGCCRMR